MPVKSAANNIGDGSVTEEELQMVVVPSDLFCLRCENTVALSFISVPERFNKEQDITPSSRQSVRSVCFSPFLFPV